MKSSGQVSFEFFFVIVVVIVVTIVLGMLTADKLSELKDRQSDARVQDVAYAVRNEVDIAHSMAPGYSRAFELPDAIDGDNYSVVIAGSSITVTSGSREFISSIRPVSGEVKKGWNTIRKSDGIVVLNG
ncbi:MAG: hypothetical protein V1702_02495 [Candidatus Woesearchaeota archaeon]